MSTQAAAPRPRLAVGVVGTGRVGAVLGAALAAVGHRVVAASGVSAASRIRADELLPGVPLMAPDEVVQRADLVLLTVPDDVLPQLVAGWRRPGRCARVSWLRTRPVGTASACSNRPLGPAPGRWRCTR